MANGSSAGELLSMSNGSTGRTRFWTGGRGDSTAVASPGSDSEPVAEREVQSAHSRVAISRVDLEPAGEAPLDGGLVGVDALEGLRAGEELVHVADIDAAGDVFAHLDAGG